MASWLRRYFFALRLFRKALLERFFHFLGAELPENADAAVVDVHHLVSLPVKVLRGIYHDPVNEFVYQLRRQFFDLGELFHLVDEPLQILGLVRLGFQIGLHFGESSFQLLLLLLVGHGQSGVPIIGEFTLGVVLAELLDQPVNIANAAFCPVQLLGNFFRNSQPRALAAAF